MFFIKAPDLSLPRGWDLESRNEQAGVDPSQEYRGFVSARTPSEKSLDGFCRGRRASGSLAQEVL
jgi:hypothetical protein